MRWEIGGKKVGGTVIQKVYIHPIKNNEVGGRWEIFFEKKVT